MITFVFSLAILVQGLTILYGIWMTATSRRRSAWALLTLGFSGMLAFRIVRVMTVFSSNTHPDWFDSYVSFFVSCCLLGAMMLIRSIYRERETHEASLRLSENRYRSLVDSVGEGILTLDYHTVRGCNPAAERILGIRASDLITKTREEMFREVIAEDGSPISYEERPASRTFHTGKPCRNIVLSYLRPGGKEGERLWLSMNSEPLTFDANGKLETVVVSFIDITDRKLAEQALRSAKDQAEKANAAKDKFLAVLSHELRTPLTPVLATIDLLAIDHDLPEHAKKDLAVIRRNVELEARLIDDLLDLTRISKGKLQLNVAPVNLHEIVGHVLDICATDIAARQIHVATFLTAEKCIVPGDPARLQQVLWNLLKNAIKFTPERGRITIRSSTHIAKACGATITLEITDNGVGIDDAALPNLFNAFEQGNAAITRQYGGLGLGLAIAKAIVELHRGTVRASSPGPGKGASFFVELPLIVRPAAAEPAPERPDHLFRHLRILLVEDHPDSSLTMSRLLTSIGHSVRSAPTVREALALANAHDFDLLLSDINLPDGTGLELIKQIRESRYIPAIALSGFGMEEDIAKSRQAGFAAHLTKPLNLDALLLAIHQVIHLPPPTKPAGESAPRPTLAG